MSNPSDHDLTVMVDRAAQAIAEKEGEDWDALDGFTKNLIREQALPFIFHGTKALAELGYRRPRVITTSEELDELAPGSVLKNHDLIVKWDEDEYRFTDGDGFGQARHVALPATVIWEPQV